MHFYLEDSCLTFGKHKVSTLSLYSYVIDWVIYVGILIVFMVYGSTFPPLYHEFSLDDITLMHSYKTEAETLVPLPILLAIAVGIPIVQFVFCSVLSTHTLSNVRKVWDIFVGITALCGAMSIQLMATCILKNICGLARPDLLSRCEPDYQMLWPQGQLASVDVCTSLNTPVVQEGFRSFPSGHASTVFCGMVLSSMNIAAKLQVFDRRGVSLKIILVVLPLMMACFVSCTRVSDNRHFLRDIIGGMIIGSSVGVIFYTSYFPWISCVENCGRAYPPRRIGIARWLNNVGGFWKIDDKLSGSFNDRCLNTREIVSKIRSLDAGLELKAQQFVDMEENIAVFTKLARKFRRDQYFNLTLSTPPSNLTDVTDLNATEQAENEQLV